MHSNKSIIAHYLSHLIFTNNIKFVDLIDDIIIKDNKIGFTVDIIKQNSEEANRLKTIAEQILNQYYAKVSIILIAHKSISNRAKLTIQGVHKIILVAAAKGGVGKSTIASLLADNLNQAGYRVGLMDADIYGPSIPLMYGLEQKPEIRDGKMLPLIARNIQINSIGLLIENSTAIWRGPMASKAIYQLMSLTHWQDLDYLIIDTPPGTGDIHISLLDNYHINGVILVTTPQRLSVIDVEKAIRLYQRYNLPIIGLIENMSYFFEPNTKAQVKLFKGNGGLYLAQKYNIRLIDQIPILSELAKSCDSAANLANIYSLNIQSIINKI